MAISAPGLGSGLDISSIVSQLMEVESQPLTRLNQKEAKVQAEISAYGSLKSALSSFKSSLSKLTSEDTFQSTKTSSSDADVLSVTSGTGAVTSSYDIKVNRLAQQHKLGSSEFAAETTFGGGPNDRLTITSGTDSFEIDLSTAMTLEEIQAAINVEANDTGITAGLISGDSGMQTLILSSGSSGYEDRVQLSFSGDVNAATFNFAMLNRDADDQALGSEQDLDASLTIDGVPVTRGSNSIDDAVAGLTLNLKTTGEATVSTSKDPLVAKKAVEGFVNAYNALKGQLSTLSSNGASSSVIRGIENQIRGVMNGVSGQGVYAYISQMGVTTNSDTGKLEFDGTKLDAALADNPDSVISFFAAEDSGFATRMDGMLAGYLDSDGVIDSIIDGANSRIKDISRSRESLERRLESTEQRYLQQFSALDSLMANMNSTSDYLASQLDALSNLTINRNK